MSRLIKEGAPPYHPGLLLKILGVKGLLERFKTVFFDIFAGWPATECHNRSLKLEKLIVLWRNRAIHVKAFAACVSGWRFFYSLRWLQCQGDSASFELTAKTNRQKITMLCETFKRLALNTWDTIAKSRRANFQLKEETFTDINMLVLKLRHSGQVKTTVFSKPEEGKNGADWEWWFNLNKSQWIGFRVQAKILNIVSEEFEHLHYQTPATGVYQCDKLIQNALTGTHPKIPLYCFYLQTDDSARLTNWSCGSFTAIRDLWGCSLLSAFEVKRLRATNHKHLSHVENLIKPWHCLVCCSIYGSRQNKIYDIGNYAKNNFPLDEDLVSDLNVSIPDSFVTQEPPSYVTAILENESNKDVLPPDEELDGIMIYTFNEETK